MATYIYETVPAKKGERVKTYEIRQSMKDPPLTEHPETGEPLRRVISGGYGLMSSGAPESRSSSGGGSCAHGGCGCAQ